MTKTKLLTLTIIILLAPLVFLFSAEKIEAASCTTDEDCNKNCNINNGNETCDLQVCFDKICMNARSAQTDIALHNTSNNIHTNFYETSIVLTLAICFPLVFLGYYLYRKFLAKIGISIIGADQLTSSFSISIGNKIKNSFMRFLANIFGDIIITTIFLIYIWAVYIFSESFISKLLNY